MFLWHIYYFVDVRLSFFLYLIFCDTYSPHSVLWSIQIALNTKVVRAAREEAHLSQAALAEQIGCDERTILNIENDRGNPKFEVLCQIIAYLHIPADQIFHPDTATDGLKKQKLLLMLQECDEQEAAEILPAIEYLLALIHKRGNSNE